MTTYHNGWTPEKLWAYAQEHALKSRLVYNTEHGSRREMGNGDIYETRITDSRVGGAWWTERIYINGALVQISEH